MVIKAYKGKARSMYSKVEKKLGSVHGVWHPLMQYLFALEKGYLEKEAQVDNIKNLMEGNPFYKGDG